MSALKDASPSTIKVEPIWVDPETATVPETSSVEFALELAFPIPNLPSTADNTVCVLRSLPITSKVPCEKESAPALSVSSFSK